MKSRLSIDFKGLDAGDGNQFEPVIRATITDSEDPRDGLMKAFFEQLGYKSNWLRADFNSQTIGGKENTSVIITPLKPKDFEDTIDSIKSRLPDRKTKEENFFYSRFNIDDEVKFTLDKWVNEALEIARKKDPNILEEDLQCVPRYDEGKIIAVKFTLGKVYYDVINPLDNKIYENIDSSFIENFS